MLDLPATVVTVLWLWMEFQCVNHRVETLVFLKDSQFDFDSHTKVSVTLDIQPYQFSYL